VDFTAAKFNHHGGVFFGQQVINMEAIPFSRSRIRASDCNILSACLTVHCQFDEPLLDKIVPAVDQRNPIDKYVQALKRQIFKQRLVRMMTLAGLWQSH